MKFIIVVLLVFIAQTSFSQASNCSSLKEGKFKSVDQNSGTTIIIRKGDEQIEEGVNDGVKLSMKVVWVSECTYELRNLKVVKGKLPYELPDNLVVISEILEIAKDHYNVKITTNLNNTVLVREISIL